MTAARPTAAEFDLNLSLKSNPELRTKSAAAISVIKIFPLVPSSRSHDASDGKSGSQEALSDQLDTGAAETRTIQWRSPIPLCCPGAAEPKASIPRGRPLDECGRLASLAAAEIISHIGARPEISLAELAKSNGLAA